MKNHKLYLNNQKNHGTNRNLTRFILYLYYFYIKLAMNIVMTSRLWKS